MPTGSPPAQTCRLVPHRREDWRTTESGLFTPNQALNGRMLRNSQGVLLPLLPASSIIGLPISNLRLDLATPTTT